ncbi:MAG: hypothetical protein OES79_00705 [Planctomycetota bacterium]|nr:hypothetical protein [Planctomycetota bacterium]
MNEALLCVISLCALGLLMRRDLLCPATVYCAVSAANAWMFYITAIRRVYPQSVAHWWMFKYDYQEIASTVFLIYLSQCIVAVGAHFLASWLAGRATPTTLDSPRWTIARWRFELNFRHPLLAYLCLLVITSMFSVVCIIHLVTIDVSSIWEYRGYLETRIPLQVGIRNGALQAFHRLLPEIGTILCLLTAFFYSRRQWSVLGLLFFPTAYAVAFTASLGSRFIVAQFASAGFVLFFLGRRHVLAAGICCMAALVSYGAVLSLRQYSGDGGVYGLRPFLATLWGGQFYPHGGIFFILFNFIQGSFNLAHAVLSAPLDYPLEYKLKSFSPAPSFVDGFASLSWLAIRKANENAPYGAYAETYLFGGGWFVTYTGLVFLSLTYLTFFRHKCHSAAAVFILCFAYLTYFLMHTYPIRNSFRLLLLSVFAAMIVNWYERSVNRQALQPSEFSAHT